MSAVPLVAMRESTRVHTRIMQMALLADESRTYWAHAEPGTTARGLATAAFEQRWFGSRSMERVKALMGAFDERFDAYAAARAALHRWQPSDPLTRANICHWHLQLSDPMYRAFTGALLPQRRQRPEPIIDRAVVVRWLESQAPGRWTLPSQQRFAGGLLTGATEAGLIAAGGRTHALLVPRVTDEALSYLLYLLREATFEGTIFDNPYLASVGLADERLDPRLRRAPGVTHHRVAGLHELQFEYPSLEAWAEARVSVSHGDPSATHHAQALQAATVTTTQTAPSIADRPQSSPYEVPR